MKKIIFLFCFILSISCDSYMQDLSITRCTSSEDINQAYSRANNIKAAVDNMAANGIPGVAVAIYSAEGWWTYSSGYAKIEGKTKMEVCHLQYLQSVAKTYMAVGILRLYEQGKIDLNKSITNYLPQQHLKHLPSPEKITVKMLLNHTSGITEYNMQPNYVATLLQHPETKFLPEDYLKYIEGKPFDFEPGSKYSYRNTNYVLLALIGDYLTGDHAVFISKVIFEPLGLSNTFYRNDPNYLNYDRLVNAYWDRYSNSILENASVLQRNNVAALVGDDGIVATPKDAVRFLKGLMDGKILKEETLALMQTWALDSKGKPAYGLGLDITEFQGETAVGHSGGGIGAGCNLYYFPQQNVFVFIGINLGTVTDSPIHKTAEVHVNQFYDALLH